MPRGFAGVRRASAELEARRGSGGPGALYFRLKGGEEAEVRFLEQDEDIFWTMMAEVPVEGRNWGKNVPIGPEDENPDLWEIARQNDLKIVFKGYINLIWFNAPVFKRDEQNKIVKDRLNDPVVTGHKPQVAVWNSGIRLFEELDEINANYKGLMSRRFRVKRKGEGLDTKYSINPMDIDSGPQPMDDAEQKLAAEKYDLNQFTKPVSPEDLLKELGQSGGGTSSTPEPTRSANPFLRNRS